ncbi:MAG: hypothetical protein GXC94_14625 [Comamonadaceae bacterium]|jgi:nitrate reductase NapE component|nr:hypothetical protein [Comamonadaceae bacterium]
MKALARGLLVVVLALGVLGFGAVGLCGGYVTVWMAHALFAPGGAGALAILALSVPCLIGGLALVWLCGGKLRALLRGPQAENDPS